MEISEAQWNEMVEKVNGFSTQIEELKNQNTTLTTKNGEYEQKLAEWQTKLNDQQRTLDFLNQNQNENKNKNAGQNNNTKAAHKSVRFDAQKGEYVWDE